MQAPPTDPLYDASPDESAYTLRPTVDVKRKPKKNKKKNNNRAETKEPCEMNVSRAHISFTTIRSRWNTLNKEPIIFVLGEGKGEQSEAGVVGGGGGGGGG